MERAPAVLPAALDVGAAAAAEERPEALLARGVGVGGELDAAAPCRPPRSPRGRARSSSRAPPRARRADLDRDSAQAARREELSGTRSSACRRSSRRSRDRCSRRSPRSNSSSRRRCSSVSWRGTVTLTSTRWSPRPKPWSTGMPFAAQHAHLARLHAGGNSSSTAPSSVSTVDRRAERGLRRSSGRPASRCRCPRARSAGRA